MSLDTLYDELEAGFQPSEQPLFLQELGAAARTYKEVLGDESKAEMTENRLTRLSAELGKERVEFGPRPDVIALGPNLFADLKFQVAPYLAQLFERFNFYLINLPITLVPRPGGGFSQLRCIVEFNPDTPPKSRPLAYQIFPQEVWQEVIHAWQGVSVGVDEKLEFKVNPAALAEQVTDVSLPVKAAVELKAGANAGFVMGPFDYRIRRPKIIAKGRGDAKVNWELTGEDRVTEDNPRLGVVLQVPKDVEQVNIDAVLSARRIFHTFTSDLYDVWDYLTERARNYFMGGAKATSQISWQDVTKGI